MACQQRLRKAKIALVNAALEVEKTEMSAEIRISDPTQMQQFLEEENKMLKSMVDKIHNIGANVLICQKGIDDIAQHYLSKHGVLAVRRVKESDMTKLAKATGGRISTNLDDISASDLGSAENCTTEKSRIRQVGIHRRMQKSSFSNSSHPRWFTKSS